MTKDNEVYTGIVIWFSASKGFGFIGWDKDGVAQPDLFLHFSDISVEGFKTIKKDTRVSFEIGTNLRGQPKAVNVTPINISTNQALN